ncbi:angiopoietin-related protein 4-like [Odontesthes bonariensis]|uniref:angiopoietin-related protein 4-like n=1 Tax=Odontesthes bonariensis TaxID=219752 RepID=UPI003F58E3A7
MKMPQLLILILTILVHAGTAFPAERGRREKQASWDDVNVVAHGLLQLGQGLKEHVDKTKAQMRDVNGKLKAFNSTMAELERKQQEQAESLKARIKEVEEKERLLAELADEVKVNVGEVKKQTEDINSRMDRLDEVLTGPALDSNDSDHAGVSFIQRLMAAQNRRIDHLVEKIQQQQDKLEKQNLHLQALQAKVAHKRMKSHKRRDEEMALRDGVEHIQAESGLTRDCHDLFVRGQRASGVYTIQPENSQPFNVLCEMTSDGGWTIIQKREDGSQNFNQLWDTYKTGFGSLNGEFWLGLDNIHSLSKQGQYILQVELSGETGKQQDARYKFQLDGEDKVFALHLEQESGDQEKIMTTGASGLPFSTADRDNDLSADINCAELLSGGWWFSSCGQSNLNGKYPKRPKHHRRQAMFWSIRQSSSLKTTLLKIAPASLNQ